MKHALRIVALWVLVLIRVPCIPAVEPTLVNMGDTWRYLKLPYRLEEPAKGWQHPDFDDRRWGMAGSEFSLEHPHLSIQGTLPRKAPSRVFMRRRFTVRDPASVHTLRLKVEHEQGFKAYLNGRLVATVTTPGISLVSGVAGSLPGEEEVLLDIADIDLSSQVALLRAGDNVLALEGDQSYQSPSPVTLAALLTADISRGPFLQSMTTTNVLVVWRTDVPLDSAVEWGPTPGLGFRAYDSLSTTQHVVNLSGLQPDTVYYYRVRSSGGGLSVTSPVDHLHTFKERGPVSFVFVGDTGQNTPAQGAVAQVMRDLQPDLVLHGGDIVYGGFDDKTPDTRVFGYYQRQTGQMQNTPFYFSYGNHDLNCCGGTPELNLTNWVLNGVSFQRTFYLPTNSATGTSHFYSFDDGDVHFVACYNPWFSAYEFLKTDIQYQWLTNDLATTAKPWKVLFFHSPMAHSGQHALADRNFNGILDQVEVMDTVGSAAVQYGVQLVLCAHEHSYERFLPTNGFHTVLSGGGGAGLYGFYNRHPMSAQFYAINHCLKIDIGGDTATIQAVRGDGRVIDSWVINRGLPLDPLYHATWNSPVVEEAPANDKDGNLNGQSFDFKGPPILGRHGAFSNPGWCHVNNDSTHLYIGFASVLRYPNQNLLLFVESPRLPGVEDMTQVGNGIIDPDGEGADALDTVKNLRFAGFRPCVGGILGDEFADTTTNRFTRPGLALNTGTGIWRLGRALQPVPGARVQQYNRSPQTNDVPIASVGIDKESNADFIEVAIPLQELGALLPGDIVKVALVVAMGEPDPATLTRPFDTTLLGSSMSRTDDGTVTIAPVSVQLALPPDLDSDSDGLPDEWEQRHGLRADSATGDDGAAGDPDGDGSTNMEEFLAGTDPHDPTSVLRLKLSPLGDARFRIDWPMVPGRQYVLQYADGSLDGYSTLLQTNLPFRTLVDHGSYTQDAAAAAGSAPFRTYRLRLEPQ